LVKHSLPSRLSASIWHTVSLPADFPKSHSPLTLKRGESDTVGSSSMQPISNVSRADVERVVRREYPPEQFEEVLAILDVYGKADWHREKDRVQLAALKLAGGNADKLLELICDMQDYRDILVNAEYPAYLKEPQSWKLPGAEKQRLSKQDRAQYTEWLYRK
jgi:hypothetical protein